MGSPTVSDSSPETGAAFTLSATVSNDGDGAAAATTLRYYRSTDATITTSDTSVGADAVAGLAALGSSAESISLTAPSTAGTYYYGACVDAVAGESNTANNCSRSVTVTVTAPAPQPDLLVSASVDDSNLNTGDSFTLSATVSNAGDEQSAASTLRYYRSTDSTISSSDTSVGTDAVGALAASGTSAESISLTAPSTAGAYYYGACVDTVTDESDTTNNCSSSVTIAVEEESSGQPDLRIVGVSTATPLDPAFLLELSSNSQHPFETMETRTRMPRRCDTTARRTQRSPCALLPDTEVGTDEVSALVPSTQVSEGIDLTAPSSAGTYYYGACVDAVTDESDTTNNCSGSVAVTVSEPQTSPDLSVGSPTVSDSGPETGAAFTLSATVSNDGDGAAAATTLRYYRSTDATITTSDTSVGTDAVAGLAALGSSAESISLTAPSTAGTYYYGACVDTVTGESDTTNNCSSSVTVTVAEPQTSPDLSVGSPTVSDSGPETGTAFTLSATVSNDGDGASAATTLRYYRSADATISSSDTQVGTDAVGALAAGGTSDESVALTAPSIDWHLLLRRLRGRGDRRVQHHEQLLVVGDGHGDGAGAATGPGSGVCIGGRQQFEHGRLVHAVGDGEQRGRRAICGVDAAVLPIDRFDDLFVGHVGRHGRGGGIGRRGDERRVDLADRALDGGCVLLRGVRGHGDGRVGHHEQLFVIGDNRCGGGVIRAAGLEDRWGKHGHPS